MKLLAQKKSRTVPFTGIKKSALVAALILGTVSAAVPTHAKTTGIDVSTMTADYVTGKKHPSDIIKEAAAKGMTMKDVFAALKKANVSIDSIVYAAITDGVSPEAVIAAAIQSGGDVAKVVDAAISAGVSAAVIKSAAVSACGCPDDVSVCVCRDKVAGALAGTTSSSAQVGAGYSAPEASAGRSAFTPPPVSSPTTGGGGGGGGGGLPASPTEPVGKAGYK